MGPVVTILCFTYNHEEYISDAIEGFLKQKIDFPMEIIIHDDASTDRTASIIKKYEKKYSNIIKTIYQKENQYSKGKTPLNFVYKNVRGKYIALCEGDDYWIDPYKLKKQIDFLETHPEFIAVTHKVRVINEHNEVLNDRNTPRYKLFKDHIFTLKDAEKMILPFQTASIFYRNIWREVDPIIFEAYLDCKANGDNKSALLLTLLGDIYCLSDVMAVHRKVESRGDSWSARTFGKNMALFRYKSIKELNKFAKTAFGVELNSKDALVNTVVNAIREVVYKPNRENIKILREILRISDESRIDIVKCLFCRSTKKILKKMINWSIGMVAYSLKWLIFFVQIIILN